MSWWFYTLWAIGWALAVRDALRWTIRSYSRSNLGWDSSLTWGHLALFGIAGIAVWPLWIPIRLGVTWWAFIADDRSDPLTRWAQRQYWADQ